jgi:putative NIF3 family GTP cyclohydrolase 1 type 2
MNRRQFAATAAAALTASNAQAVPLTAQQYIDRITAKMAAAKNVSPAGTQFKRDTIKAGDPATPITGIATTFMATLDVLHRAQKSGRNLVISHEPTFWHDPEPLPELAADPLTRSKLGFIEKNKMVVWRSHDQMHGMRPDPIFLGWAKALNWEKYRSAEDPCCYTLPATTVDAVAQHHATKLKTRSARLIGDPKLKVTKVAQGGHGLEENMRLLAKSDLIIVFEARERDTAEYVRDLVAAGLPKAMLLCAHLSGEEAGMDEYAQWLRTIITEVAVEYIPAGDQFTI